MNCECGGYVIILSKDNETYINHTITHYRCTKCGMEEITDETIYNR